MGVEGEPRGEPTDQAHRRVAAQRQGSDAPRTTDPVESAGGDGEESDRVRTCGVCGGTSGSDGGRADLSWSTSVEDGRRLEVCPPCTRANVRSIEGKLRAEWW